MADAAVLVPAPHARMAKLPPYRIVPATEAHVPGIWAVYGYYILHSVATAQAVVPDAAGQMDWFHHHPADTYPVFVAVADTVAEDGGAAETVLGWCSLSQWSTREAYYRTAETSVYVAQAALGHGLGKALMEFLIPHVHAHIPRLRLLIARFAGDNAASRKLHTELGFTKLGVMLGAMEKFGREIDVEMMQYVLPAR